MRMIGANDDGSFRFAFNLTLFEGSDFDQREKSPSRRWEGDRLYRLPSREDRQFIRQTGG